MRGSNSPDLCNARRHLADLDDPCTGDGDAACSVDKKMRLICKGGKMIKESDCNCSVMIDQIRCN